MPQRQGPSPTNNASEYVARATSSAAVQVNRHRQKTIALHSADLRRLRAVTDMLGLTEGQALNAAVGFASALYHRGDLSEKELAATAPDPEEKERSVRFTLTKKSLEEWLWFGEAPMLGALARAGLGALARRLMAKQRAFRAL